MDTTKEETAALSRERLEFEKASAAQAHELAYREILVKEKEYLLKEAEAKSQKWFNPLTLAIIAAAVGFFANATVAYINGIYTRALDPMSG